MLGPPGVEGLRVLDLYAGTGGFGLDALRRGAAWAEFVEIDERRCESIRQEAERLHFAERCRVRRGDAVAVAERLEGEFDVVFVDPPYGLDLFERLFGRLSERGLLAESAVAFLEHSSRMRLPDELPGLRVVQRKTYGDSAVTVYRAGGGA
jgi:16S rRNA (guanine966-N2)-methyltransferase